MKSLLKKLFGIRDKDPLSRAPVSQPALNPDTLRQSLREAASEAEREALERELGMCLGQGEGEPADTDGRLVWLSALCAATDTARAAVWLERIGDDADLEQIAVTARLADIRLMAAERIDGIDAISRLAQKVRDKDRGVYRYCQDRQKRHAEQAHRAAQVEELREAARQLATGRPIASGRLYELRKRLTDLEDGPDLAECRALLEEAGRYEHEETTWLRAREKQVDLARHRLESINDQELSASGLDTARAWLAELDTVAESVPASLASGKEFTELHGLIQAMRTALNAMEEDARRVEQCRGFLDGIEGQVPTPEMIAAWESLLKPDRRRSERDALMARWEQIQAGHVVKAPKPPKPRQSPSQHRMTDIEGFRHKLDQLEQALEAGNSRQAFSLAGQIDSMARAAKPPKDLDDRYHDLHSRLSQLRDWARWSSGQARDHLIEEAEALAGGGISLALIDEAVPRLREEWKHLDGLGRASQADWQRFDQALNTAYQPVLAEREERNARWAAIRQAKTSLLNEAEAWLKSLADPIKNPGELQQKAMALRKHWRGAERGGPQDERQLQARFRDLMTSLEERIAPYVAAEAERRNRLVAAAFRLVDIVDLRETLTQARRLRERWREESNGIQLPRTIHQEQLKQFREAMDQVYARRDANRKEREAQREDEARARQDLLADLEGMLRNHPTPAKIETSLEAFHERWEALSEGAKRPQWADLERQAEQLILQAEAMIVELRAVRHHEIFSLMARKAAWAEELEAIALSGGDVEAAIHRIEADWRHVHHALPGDLEKKLHERLKRAPHITDRELEEGHLQRAELLVELEILLDLPTPPAFSEIRQTRQLEWLQTSFHGYQEPALMLTRVGTWYATPATADTEQMERMEKITERLAERLTAQ